MRTPKPTSGNGKACFPAGTHAFAGFRCGKNPLLLTLSKHRDPCELQLIECAQAGDGDAFGGLVCKYQPRVSNHIQRRVQNPEVAKDLSQETWLRAFRSIKSFRCDAAFSSWLYRIAENVCIDYFRKQKHRDTQPLHLIDEHRLTETDSCPSQDLLRKELRLHLKNALDCLSTPRKQVFVLYYLHELPIKAIAGRLNRSEGTIKTHLRNARRQLQEVLMPYLNNEDPSRT